MLLTLLDRRLAASFLAVAHLLLIVAATPGSTTAAERVLFYHNDALGSPVAMTDAAGSVVWRADYEPFGGIAAESGTVGNTHQFTGKERDPETGLQYFGARFYDGGIGRFLSVDPALLRGRPAAALQSPQQLNLYAYSANNPYRFIDRDGRFILPLLFALGGALAANVFNPGAVNAPAIDQAPQDLVNSQTTAEFARDTLIGEVIGLGTGKAITAVGGVVVKRAAVKGAVITSSASTGIRDAMAGRILDLLRSGGELVGKAGNTRIRVLPGGMKEAEAFFRELGEGGPVIKDLRFPGTMVELPGGGRVGFRPVSKSGPPTIDVNIPGLKGEIKEIKFVD